jgi:hypothetical protein
MKKLLLLIGFASLTMTAQVPSYVPTNGLVGYWPVNGNANDMSPNANNGTNKGATITADRFGNINSAYVFNGSNSIDIGNIAVSNVKTYSFWIYPTDLSGIYRTVMSKFEGNSNLASFEIGQREAQKMGFAYSPNGTNGYITNSQSSLNINTWYNFVITFDNNLIKMYVNGILEQTSPNSGTCYDNNDHVFIGATRKAIIGDPSSFFWIGKIDDIGIWNRALTEQEISNLYNANICYQNITVTDTLIINTGILSYNPVTYNNTVTIYPNPAKDHITIDCGNLANVNGYSIKITNSLGQVVFNQPMSSQQYNVALNSWTGQGMYFVNILDNHGTTIDTRKIILQ